MADRYADPITLDHIIELRRKLAEAERQRDNCLAVLTDFQRSNIKLRSALGSIGYGPPHEGEPLDLLNRFVDIARRALNEEDE